MTARFDHLLIASPLHEEAALARVRGMLEPGLARLGGEAPAGTAGIDRPMVVVVLTGGTEHPILDAWRAHRAVRPWAPLVLVAHPSQNSLPAALEALARVHQEGGRGRIAYLAGADDVRGWSELDELIADLEARQGLEGLRIGMVGQPSDWLVASTPDPAVVARRWGPEVVEVDMGAVLTRFAHEPTPVALAEATVAGSGGMREPEAADVAVAVRATSVLADAATEQHLDAVTVRCFDLVTEAHTSGCLALAELNDRGLVAGCEGDVVSTVTMAWLRLLLGETPWMANPSRVDVDADRVLLAHCTIARSLLTGYRLRSHFESGLGVAIEGDVAATEVTLVRVGGAGMDRLWLGEGTVVPATHDEDLCRTQLTVALDRGHARELLEDPLGNHVTVVPGRHADRLQRWWELLIA